jgi:hypothetical protein
MKKTTPLIERYSALAVLLVIAAAILAPSRMVVADDSPTYHLPLTSKTVYRGFYPRNAPLALTVPSGAVVTIDTLSHQGLNSLQNCTPSAGDLTRSICVASGALDPIDFQAQQGIPPAKSSPTRRKFSTGWTTAPGRKPVARTFLPVLSTWTAPSPATHWKCGLSV